MKMILPSVLFICCAHITSEEKKPVMETAAAMATVKVDREGRTIESRFAVPDSFKRLNADSASFAFYLQHLPLKPFGEPVKYFDGSVKLRDGVYCAVVDMEIGNRDLQQCADAVMRLRGEYLFARKRYDQISFRFTGDGKMHGFREYANNDHSYKKFRKYMDHVFSYANTGSLKKQLNPVPFHTLQVGDVLVKSGDPYGHAVIVVDLCINARGKKQYMLAQSYMPAQETQVLLCPDTDGPWYEVPERSTIHTPEWTFDTTDLRRW
jgi:hypothetical protein